MALVDWVDVLTGFSEDAINAACAEFLRTSRGRRPVPGEIRALCDNWRQGPSGASRGDKSKLTRDELHLLESNILPTARNWLGIPGLAHHGKSTLEYWGET